MIRLFVSLLQWLRRWWKEPRRHHDFTGIVVMESTTDCAAAIRARKLVLVGSPAKYKWLRFSCPCRCGEVIALNLMPSYSPRWSVDVHPDDTLTVSPSVDATTCKSHFWIRRSKISWVDG